jgi:hypothetical protein
VLEVHSPVLLLHGNDGEAAEEREEDPDRGQGLSVPTREGGGARAGVVDEGGTQETLSRLSYVHIVVRQRVRSSHIFASV